MRRRLLPLSALRAFEAAGRHESFQKAADELGVTTSAVSRQVAELERVVGGKLFVRNIRKVTLTDEGNRLRESLSVALDRMTDALQETRIQLLERSSQPTLRVHVLTTFATRIIIPRLPQFEGAHPDIAVMLTVATEQATGADSEFDLFVGYSRTAPDEHATILFREDALPVCAPHYIGGKDVGSALALDDILKGRLLSATEDSWDWKLWASLCKLKWPAHPRLMHFENDDMAIQAALAGTGIALAERRFITSELADHRLVPVGRSAAVPLGYYVVRRHGGADGASAQVFEDWLRRTVAALEQRPPAKS